MTSIVMLRLLIDFGLVILIWIIQLIVYPSFHFYKTENLIIWHKKYTPRIGYIVGPLMLIQLGIAIYHIIQLNNIINVINLLIISVIWLFTFLKFIPIHNNISKGQVTKQMLASLVNRNWLRTVLWTLLFFLNIMDFGQTLSQDF